MNKLSLIYVIRTIGLLLSVWIIVSCERSGDIDSFEEDIVPVELKFSLDTISTRTFINNQTHSVNRILILPFVKISESLNNSNTNFIPEYSRAKQLDVPNFPVYNATLHLPRKTTYKVLVVGYNQNDFDFYQYNSVNNKFNFGPNYLSETFNSFGLYVKSATVVSEFFVGVCDVFNGSVSLGQVFRPEQNVQLSGNLKRLVSGFSVKLTSVPTFVNSVSLIAENLVKASKTTDASVLSIQTSGDGESRTLGTVIPPSNRIVTFDKILLPTQDANKTAFFLDFNFGSFTQRYTIKVPDSEVSVSNRFILNQNQAINVTGDYSTINLGFTLSFGINLDDNNWDGLQ